MILILLPDLPDDKITLSIQKAIRSSRPEQRTAPFRLLIAFDLLLTIRFQYPFKDLEIAVISWRTVYRKLDILKGM